MACTISGRDTSPGYAVVNVGARYQVHRRLELFAQVNNLLDRHYYTAAQLGTTAFTASGDVHRAPISGGGRGLPGAARAPSYAPGAPRAAWGGIRIKF